jgi:hypothetical protein
VAKYTFAVLLALSACDPNPFVDFTGKFCTKQSDCPQGYVCQRGQCAVGDGGVSDGG